MTGLVFNIAQIAAGLLLAQTALMKFDAIDETVAKVTKWLDGFKASIGCITLILGLLNLIRSGCFINDLLGIATGLLLLGVGLRSVPLVGGLLEKGSMALKSFAVPIGIAALAFGVYALVTKNCLLG